MLDPCFDCPRSDVRDKYLEFILPSCPSSRMPNHDVDLKNPVPVAAKSDRDGKVKKENPVKVSAKTKPDGEKTPVKCLMGGCGLDAKVKGYCQNCFSLRRYHERLGNPVPDVLTEEQIMRRKNKGK